jgi:hypothetical protein
MSEADNNNLTLKNSSSPAVGCLSPEQKEAKNKSRKDVQARIDEERNNAEAEAQARADAAKAAQAKREEELRIERERREA